MPSNSRPFPLKLLLRADASERIGSGHLLRSLALARELIDRGGIAVLVGSIASDAMCRRVRDAGVTLVPLEAPAASAGDLAATAAELVSLGATGGNVWAVLDSYHLHGAYLAAIRRIGFPVLVIDDLADRDSYDADLLLNQNLGAEGLRYRANADMRVLLGVRYALLRPEFAAAHSRVREIPETARRILVTVGGSDPCGITRRLLSALERTTVDGLSVVVVAGAMADDSIERVCPTLRYPCVVRRDVEDMAVLMEDADLAITAAGSTCWELACVGVPAIVFDLVDNQRRSAEFLAASGVAEWGGSESAFDERDLARRVDALCRSAARRSAMSAKGRALVDGTGVTRVLRRMGEGLPPVTLRRAERADARPLWELANDRTVRERSFNPSPIGWETHVAWFERMLTSPTTRLWVFESDRGLAGQIRYERAQDAAEIGISIGREFRGWGLGARLLAATWLTACRELGVSHARGVVMTTNQASAAAFREAGFMETASTHTIADRQCHVFTRTADG